MSALQLDPDPYGPPSPLVVRWAQQVHSPGRVLDLGCGHGRHSVLLARRGWAVDAVDHDPRALRSVARHAVSAPIRVVDQDLCALRWTNLPDRDDGYRLVLLFRVLYQLPDQREGVLRRAWERVGPHGELLVVDTTAGIDAALGQLSDAAVRERSLRHARLARSGSDHTDYA